MDGEALSDKQRLNSLTPREREGFDLLLKGFKMKEAAQAMNVQPTTISFHSTSLYKKLGIHNRGQLFLRYGRVAEEAAAVQEKKEAAL